MPAKDMTQLLRRLGREGFTVGPLGKNSRHRVNAPDGAFTFVSPTSRDTRAAGNVLAWAYNHGLSRPENVAIKHTRSALEATADSEEGVAMSPRRRPDPAAVADPFVGPADVPGAGGCVLLPTHPAYPEDPSSLVHLGGKVWLEPRRMIGPELAERLLQYNEGNRNPSERSWASYARDIAEGRWNALQGDPIRVADTGKLLDGQQRLMAIVKARKTLPFMLITGLPESAQDTVDSGRRRTVGDQLRINGVSNSIVVAATGRMLWEWEHDALLSGIIAPSNAEVLDYVTERMFGPVSLEQAVTEAGIPAKKLIRSAAAASSVYYLAMLADQQAAQEFFSKLITGANLSQTSPILALRETAAVRIADGRQLRSYEWLYLLARAWTLWRTGKQAQRIQFPKGGLTMQSFPWIQ